MGKVLRKDVLLLLIWFGLEVGDVVGNADGDDLYNRLNETFLFLIWGLWIEWSSGK